MNIISNYCIAINEKQKGLEIMKRKYLALALGLALTFTSMKVAFAATDSTTKITTEAADTKMLPQMTQLIKAVLQKT